MAKFIVSQYIFFVVVVCYLLSVYFILKCQEYDGENMSKPHYYKLGQNNFTNVYIRFMQCQSPSNLNIYSLINIMSITGEIRLICGTICRYNSGILTLLPCHTGVTLNPECHAHRGWGVVLPCSGEVLRLPLAPGGQQHTVAPQGDQHIGHIGQHPLGQTPGLRHCVHLRAVNTALCTHRPTHAHYTYHSTMPCSDGQQSIQRQDPHVKQIFFMLHFNLLRSFAFCYFWKLLLPALYV